MTNNLMQVTSAVPQVLAAQFLANSETTQYTATTVVVKIANATICNTTGSTAIVSISLVKAGDTAGTKNRILSSYNLVAGSSFSLTELKDHVLGISDFISATCGTATAVAFTLSGTVFS